jgi:pimeloyl-ACP methyl ester carboxylesterase
MPIAKNGSIEIYYEIHGDGEPLVLINGLGGDHAGLKWSPPFLRC